MARTGRPTLTPEERREAQAITERLFDRVGTQRALADKLGITEQAVSKWTKGTAGWLRLAQVCRAAGVSADELLGIVPSPDAPGVAEPAAVYGVEPVNVVAIAGFIEAARRELSRVVPDEEAKAAADRLSRGAAMLAQKRSTRPGEEGNGG